MKPGSNDDAYMNDGSDEEEGGEEPHLLASGVTLPFSVSKHLKGAPCRGLAPIPHQPRP